MEIRVWGNFRRGKRHPWVPLKETPGTAAFHAQYEQLLQPSSAESAARRQPPQRGVGCLRSFRVGRISREHTDRLSTSPRDHMHRADSARC